MYVYTQGGLWMSGKHGLYCGMLMHIITKRTHTVVSPCLLKVLCTLPTYMFICTQNRGSISMVTIYILQLLQYNPGRAWMVYSAPPLCLYIKHTCTRIRSVSQKLSYILKWCTYFSSSTFNAALLNTAQCTSDTSFICLYLNPTRLQ